LSQFTYLFITYLLNMVQTWHQEPLNITKYDTAMHNIHFKDDEQQD